MLWTALAVLMVLWLLGVMLHLGGSSIHFLLVAGFLLVFFDMLTGPEATG